MPHCESTSPSASPGLLYRARIADFNPMVERTPRVTKAEQDEMFRLNANSQGQINVKVLFEPETLQDFVISGVLDGWQEVYVTYGLSSLGDASYWNYLPYMDAQLKGAGHGQAARIVCAWYFLLLSQVSPASDLGPIC